MRGHLSVFMLFVRSSLYKTLALCLLMAAAQLGVYFFAADIEATWLENLVDEGAYRYIFAVFTALMMLMLVQNCTGRGAKPIYTLARLSVSRRCVFVWQSVSNALLWLIFLSTEIFVMLGISAHFAANAPEDAVTSQTLFLAFYRSEFLHSLLPMEYIGRWIRNVIYVIGLGVVCANASAKIRRGRLGYFLPGVMLAFAVFTFVSPMGEMTLDGMGIGIFVLVCAGCVLMQFTGGEEIEDEEAEETP